jgi:hypothetical protein
MTEVGMATMPVTLGLWDRGWDGRRARDFGSSKPSLFRFSFFFLALRNGCKRRFSIYIHTHTYVFIIIMESLCCYIPGPPVPNCSELGS